MKWIQLRTLERRRRAVGPACVRRRRNGLWHIVRLSVHRPCQLEAAIVCGALRSRFARSQSRRDAAFNGFFYCRRTTDGRRPSWRLYSLPISASGASTCGYCNYRSIVGGSAPPPAPRCPAAHPRSVSLARRLAASESARGRADGIELRYSVYMTEICDPFIIM